MLAHGKVQQEILDNERKIVEARIKLENEFHDRINGLIDQGVISTLNGTARIEWARGRQKDIAQI